MILLLLLQLGAGEVRVYEEEEAEEATGHEEEATGHEEGATGHEEEAKGHEEEAKVHEEGGLVVIGHEEEMMVVIGHEEEMMVGLLLQPFFFLLLSLYELQVLEHEL